MKQFYILDKLNMKVEMEQVLQWVNCTTDSPVYEEFVEEYREMEKDIPILVQPAGVLGFGQLAEDCATEKYPSGTKVLYAVTTVGGSASAASTQAFAEGNYVRGMLWDAIADVALFSLENDLQRKVKEVCGMHRVGIEKRLEAPQDIPMEVQRQAWETLKLKERLDIEISSGFMLDPVKSSCQVFVLSSDINTFRVQHDCRSCSNLTCRMRKVYGSEITVKRSGEETKLLLEDGESLMDGLLREGFYISAICGGKGRCGKCKVRVLGGKAEATREDKKFFTAPELEAGWRLSCLLYPTEDLKIAFDLNDEAEFETISGFARKKLDRCESDVNVQPGDVLEMQSDAGEQKYPENQEQEYCNIAIDIGTTTIAFQLFNQVDQVLHTVTAINSQRKFGADVISRIQASVEGKKEVLQSSIRKDLQAGITSLLEGSGHQLSQVKKVSIACNTTMSHLLMGYDCESLGLYPFTPVNIDFIPGSVEEIIGLKSDAEVVILPGISTYVGGDIVSGLYACGFHESDEINLLVDLGTNGEMALGNRKKLLVTSTAAGPAFEGGNLTWGMGSVAGAICAVKLNKGQVQTDTISNQPPIGICGTGVVEAIAEMLREEIIDEMGLLEEEYFEDGYPLATTAAGEQIVLTQKDIRELQLAKAAVRAGIETLCLRYGVGKEQVSKVYLAGGFGYRLDVEKAMAIGMLPEEFAGRTLAVGNSSLAGAGIFPGDEHSKEILQKIVSISEEIGLSMDKDFNEFYMEHMMFE